MSNSYYNIVHLEEIDSTNDYAQKLISTNKQVDRTIVLADYQTKGKGQRNNVWSSEKSKNLLMSIILQNINLEPAKYFYLSMITSLAIVKTLNKIVKKNVEIKWPNDILINSKKVAGILITNTIRQNKINNSIIGIGINVNQSIFESELSNATSIFRETIKKYEVSEILTEVLDNFFSLYNKDFNEIKNNYEQNMFKIGKLAELVDGKGTLIKSKILGIKQNGELIVNIKGRIKNINHSEYRLII